MYNTLFNKNLRYYHIDDLKKLYENHPYSKLEIEPLIKTFNETFLFDCFTSDNYVLDDELVRNIFRGKYIKINTQSNDVIDI